MKIQSAGRLGNQLFIFGHALDVQINSKVRSVEIFADKFHSEINQELLDTFKLLSSYGVNLGVNNYYGFLLKAIDKLGRSSPRLSILTRRTLRIETEGRPKVYKLEQDERFGPSFEHVLKMTSR